MKGRCGGPRSKPYHSSLHSYLGKEGFALPRRDAEMEGGGGGETRRTGGPLSEREGGYGGRVGDKGKTDQEGKRGRFIIKSFSGKNSTHPLPVTDAKPNIAVLARMMQLNPEPCDSCQSHQDHTKL